jgi:homoserine kinase
VLCNEGSYSDLAKLVFPEQWQFVLAYSGQRVPTEDMRKILPAKFSKDLLTLQSRELTQFIRALAVGDHRGAAEHIVDHLAEPLRAPLLEGYSDAREQCLALGARAVGISGSGPTLFAVCDSDTVAASLCHWLENNYRAADHAFVKLCRLQTTGVRVSISEQ